MPILNPTDLTFNGREIDTLSAAIFEKTYHKPAITEFHQIVPGIKARQQIAFLGLLGLTGKKRDGCTTPLSEQTIANTEKFWEPVVIAEKLGECWNNLKETFFVWGAKNGIQRDDLTDTDFAAFIEDRMADSLYEAVLRTAWFGDTAAATYDDNGKFTDSTDIAYFNALNGFWKQLFALAPTNSPRRVAIPNNAATTPAGQLFSNNNTINLLATNEFANLKYNADIRLREQPNLVYIATQSLVDQYCKELRSQALDASFVKIESGYNALMFEGIPIIPVSFFDRIIANYQTDSAGLRFNPHRAVLTTTQNLAIGTETPESLAELDAWYSNDDEQYYLKYAVNMDAKVLEDYLVQVAY